MPYKFLISSTSSGSGKTSITIALISALKKLSYKVYPFKVGPDFIDPGYLTIASGNITKNLDSWMLSKDYNHNLFYSIFSDEKTFGVVEGVMGLFDGFSGTSDDGSTSQIAKWLNIPVILIIDAKSMARSVAAVINGFLNFDKSLKIKGIILNKVGSLKHLKYLKDAIEKYCNVELLGYFLKDDFPELSSRHLGLITVEDNPEFKNKIDKFGEIALNRIDFDKLFKISYFETPKIEKNLFKFPKRKKIKIGIAKDNAFCFYYWDNFKILEMYGAEISFFSPIKDSSIPQECDILYFGGGYPELYAKELSENKSMIESIKKFFKSNKIIYAECGGFIYLLNGVKIDGNYYEFVGIFNDTAILDKKLRSLGYREITLSKDCPFGKKGLKARGHEFHYSYLENNGKYLNPVYENSLGYIEKNTIGSYVHIHFGSNLKFAENLISSAI